MKTRFLLPLLPFPRFPGGLALGLLLLFGAGLPPCPALAAPAPAPPPLPTPDAGESAYANIAVFTRALQLIRQDYVDEGKTAYRTLVYAALRGMFNALDPHSRFMEPRELRGMEADTKGEFGGLGISVSLRDGLITVVSLREDAPAIRAGLLPGDQILKINGESTDQMPLSQALDRLRGAAGQKVTLTLLRPATRAIKDFVVERAIIKVASVKDTRLLDEPGNGKGAAAAKIGYVRITEFNEPTAAELGAQLDKLEALGMQALVLDLRDNAGGLLEGAVDVCGQFVGPGTMVVSTEGRVASARKLYKTPANAKKRPQYPVAVLINGGSASAAEIVAGALRDLRRAVLVGETSFGKGSVQSVIELQDGAGVRLTTAKYYTPGRQVIHEKGIAPDLRVPLTPEQENALTLQRRESENSGGTGGPPLSAEEKQQLAQFRDAQLERAAAALKGLVLYTALCNEAGPVE